MRIRRGEDNVQHLNSAQTGGGDSLAPEALHAPLQTFIDANAGADDGIDSFVDSMRQPSEQNGSFSDWFKRPVLLRTTQWGTGTVLDDSFDPWTTYLNQADVKKRLDNFVMLKGTLRVKFIINGNPFLFGRGMIDYLPLPSQSSLVLNRPLISFDLVEASQRPRVIFDPSTSEGGELSLPMFTPSNYIGMLDQSISKLGVITYRQINPLKHANGATSAVNIQAYGWMEDVEFLGPTSAPIDPGTQILNASDEYAERPISEPATAVANTAAKLKDVPIVGPYARATEMAARAVAGAAGALGFSKTRQLEMEHVRFAPAFNTATANGKNLASSLALDQKCELSISPKVCGVSASDDELALSYVCSKESYLGTFQWATSTSSPVALGRILVDPGVTRTNGDEIHFPALAFAAWPFTYWRGSLKYRFEVVCSKYHRGRFRITYDPGQTTVATSTNIPTTQSMIVDISENTDFCFTVGYTQPAGFKRVFDDDDSLSFATGFLSYGPTRDYGNGVLTITVVNPLTAPNSTTDNNIAINVYVSGGDDLQFAVPNNRIARYEPVANSFLVNPAAAVQQLNADSDNVTVSHHPPTIEHFGAPIVRPENVALIHFGEQIDSLRTLMKRYCLHEVTRVNPTYSSRFPTSEGYVLTRKYRPAFPVQGGFLLSDAANGTLDVGEFGSTDPTVIVGEGNDQTAFVAATTIANWVTTAYSGFRGSNRWMCVFPTTMGDIPINVKRHTANHFRDLSLNVVPVPVTETFQFNDALLTLRDPFTAECTTGANYPLGEQDGGTGFNISGESIATQSGSVVEFELPFYNNYRFAFAKDRNTADKIGSEFPNQLVGSYSLQYELESPVDPKLASRVIRTYHSVGEDFQVYWFTGQVPMQLSIFN